MSKRLRLLLAIMAVFSLLALVPMATSAATTVWNVTATVKDSAGHTVIGSKARLDRYNNGRWINGSTKTIGTWGQLWGVSPTPGKYRLVLVECENGPITYMNAPNWMGARRVGNTVEFNLTTANVERYSRRFGSEYVLPMITLGVPSFLY